MSSNRTLMVLPGDGVGPEVVNETLRVVEWLAKNKSITFNVKEGLVGGASYEKHKNPITDEVFYKALESEAVILGAVGGPKYDNLEFSKRPERALLKLRKLRGLLTCFRFTWFVVFLFWFISTICSFRFTFIRFVCFISRRNVVVKIV